MAARSADFLLIGGGLASGHCAAELRKRGADGSILLVGREPEPPYERPPLSKEYLRGEASREDAYVNPASWYEENEVELMSGVNVMSLDADDRAVTLQGGERVGFEKALLGTGAVVNILRVEGAENEGIHYLRAFGNSDAIRADAEAAEHVVLIGGSYIGTEVAASLTAKGVKCTILMMEDVTLSRTFGEDAGRWFQETIEGHGITVHGGEELEAFEGDGRVRSVVTKSGLAIECDTVIVGAGVRADAMLAERAGLEVENGIVCDSKLQTSAAGIYAAGDCCSYDSVVHGRRLRVEHWDVALHQPEVIAANVLGGDEVYDPVPYFWSEQFGRMVQYVGHHGGAESLLWRGDPAEPTWSACWLAAGRLVAILTVDRPRDMLQGRRLIASTAPVDASRLTDPAIPVKETVLA